MLASHDSERTGPPPHGSRKGWGTPLFPTVLLSVSLSFIVVLIYQLQDRTGSTLAAREQAGKNAIVAEMKDHHTTLESLQQAMKEIKLKMEADSKTWVHIINSIEQLQDVDQQWSDELEALLSRFKAMEAVRQVQAQHQSGAAEPRADAQLGLCSKSASIFAKPPPRIDLPFSAETKDWGMLEDAAFASFKLHPSFAAPSAQGGRNLSIYVYASGDFVSDDILNMQSWEPTLIQSVVDQLYQFAKEKGLKHEEVYLLDIGANIGTFSLAAAAHGFSVIAFEPMLTNRMAFQLSLCTNPGLEERVTLVGKGLGNASATCALYSAGGNQGDGFVRCGDQSDVPEGVRKRATLEVVRLDEELRSSIPRLRGRVGAVKIDVEGFEPQVFAGAGEFFREVAPPYITAECGTTMLRDASGVAPEEFLHQVHGLGYTIRDQSFQVIPVEEFAAFQGCEHNINVFFTRGVSGTTGK